MGFLIFWEEVRKALKGVLKDLGIDYDEIILEEPPSEGYGHISTPLPLRLAKRMKMNPVEIARSIADNIGDIKYLEKSDVAPPGYVNFYVDKFLLYDDSLSGLLRDKDTFLRLDVGKDIKVRIEHTSVNPNKAIHIGHARNMVLGDTLARILGFLGYETEVLNYIDDTGVQMADLIIGFKYLGFDVESKELPFDQYCGDVVYVSTNEKIESDTELQRIRREVLHQIEDKDTEISRFARRLADRVLKYQLLTAWRLGVKYDYFIWESDIVGSEMHASGFKVVKKSPLVKLEEGGKYRGCWVVEVDKIDKFRGESDEVLVRSDGTMTYLGKDIIFAMWKLGLFKYPLKVDEYAKQPDGNVIISSFRDGIKELTLDECDLSVNVIGGEQRRPQEILRHVLASIYGKETFKRYIHYSYESVVLSRSTAEKYLGLDVSRKIQRMSGRKGIYINVDPFLDMLREEAYKIARKNNPDISDDMLREISEGIAVTSLRYNMLNADRDRIVVFDVDKMLDVKGETGTYIMYSYARASSVLSKAEAVNYATLDLNEMSDIEDRILMMISKFRLKLINVSKTLEIKPLSRYIYDLSLLFNEFYEKCPILREPDDKIRERRLMITKAYHEIMKTSSELLGLRLVDRM